MYSEASRERKLYKKELPSSSNNNIRARCICTCVVPFISFQAQNKNPKERKWMWRRGGRVGGDGVVIERGSNVLVGMARCGGLHHFFFSILCEI